MCEETFLNVDQMIDIPGVGMHSKLLDDSVWWGSDGCLNEALHDLSDWLFRITIRSSLWEPITLAMTEAVWRAVSDAVWQDPPHPGLQDFLFGIKGT